MVLSTNIHVSSTQFFVFSLVLKPSVDKLLSTFGICLE